MKRMHLASMLLLVLLSSFLPLCSAADVPIKVCANTITANLSSFLRESGSINPQLDAIDKKNAVSRKLLLLSNDEDGAKGGSGGEFLEGVSLHKVRLAPGSSHAVAQATNLDYLLMLNVDNLVYGFRNVSGVSPLKGKPYGGWESPDKELRGHFVGHYLSATSMMWASTHDPRISRNMNAVVDALEECQERIGTGYLSAFPDTFFDRYEAIHVVWAPYYTIHKIMAGLLDQYTYAGNTKALRMVTWMADYFAGRVEAYVTRYTIEAQFQSLNEEVGGMNDVLYNLYKITANPRHLRAAHLFDKPCFLGLLAIQQDSLSGFHANTHIPLVVGSQSRYEVTGDTVYKDLSAFFMKSIMNSHMYATGGTSVKEFWVDPRRLGTSLDKDTEETCATYNLLKVARNLFRWTKDIMYADYYERALLNGIVSVQRKHEPGVMLYMLPLAPGNSKNSSTQHWGTEFDSFWCCYGTAVESFSKLGDSIYFEGPDKEKRDELYIIQFVSSSMPWEAVGLMLHQTVKEAMTSDHPALSAEVHLQQDETMTPTNKVVSLYIRIPGWASPASTARLNNKQMRVKPGTFLEMRTSFEHGDRLSLYFPTSLRLEHIQDDRHQYSKVNSISFGPYLLAGLSTGDWETGSVDVESPSSWIKPVSQEENKQLYSFGQQTNSLDSRNASSWSLAHSNGTLVMTSSPSPGTDSRFQATFRVIILEPSPHPGLIGKTIALELMDQPSRFVSHNGVEQEAVVSPANSTMPFGAAAPRASSLFRVRESLSHVQEVNDAVSLEAADQPGCFLSSSTSGKVLLLCKPLVPNDIFESSASFKVSNGLAQYHPLSFVASGYKRSYLLFPLSDYVNEHYTVYFDMK